MAYLPKPSKHAFNTTGESMTEQEFKKSCDINQMMKDLHRGLNVRTAQPAAYGYEDMNMSRLDVNLEIQRLEKELTEYAEANEFLQHELDAIPENIRKKFNFRLKKPDQQKPVLKNDELNDDKKDVTGQVPNKKADKNTKSESSDS